MTRFLTCAALALVLTGCGIISRPIVSVPPARCSALIPDSWSEGVDAASVPANDPRLAEWLGEPLTAAVAAALIAPWAGAYVAMSGQLEKANGRSADTVSIVAECETLVNAARADQQ